jgi:hypothetical protein
MSNVSFSSVFGGNAVQPSQVSYAAYNIPPSIELFWPSTGTSTDAIVADNIDILTTGAGATVTMPDATQVSTGQSVFFSNLGTNVFSVLDFDGNTIATVPIASVSQNNWVRILLVDNTTQAGEWHVAQLGATTAAPQAAALAGNGLVALSGRLNANVPIVTTNANPYTFQVSDRAKCYVYTGGQATYTLPAANTFPNGWFVGIANRSADGQLTITSTSLIDGSNTLVLAIDQDCYIFTDGISYTTFGLGTLTFFLATVNQTQLVNNASVTLSPLQATKQIQIVTGTQNQDTDFIFPNINGIYYLSNQTNLSAFSLKVKATGGANITTVASGQRYIFVNDGTEMRSYPTSISDVKFPDGNASDPGMSFEGAPTSGWFVSPGSGVGGSVLGAQILNMSAGGLSLIAGAGLSLNNDADSFSVTHSAAPALASDAEYVWPEYPATDGDVLACATDGILSWITPAAPSASAKYIIQETDASLPNAQSIGDLTTGLLKNTVTTGTGVLSAAVAGTDYVVPNARLTDVAAFNVTKGGVVTANGTNLVQLPVGTNGQVLTAASGQTTGLQWATLTQRLPQTISTVVGTALSLVPAGVNTFVDVTGLAASITPLATTSKVLVTVNMGVSCDINGDVVLLRITRNETPIGVGTPIGANIATGASVPCTNSAYVYMISYTFFDSPASVAAQTYQAQVALDNGSSSTISINSASGNDGSADYNVTISTITLQEVLG